MKNYAILFYAVAACIILAVFLLMLSRPKYSMIPFSDFETFLSHNQVKDFTIDGDEIFGDFNKPEKIPGIHGPIVRFRASYPQGTFTRNGLYLKHIHEIHGFARQEPMNFISYLKFFGQ